MRLMPRRAKVARPLGGSKCRLRRRSEKRVSKHSQLREFDSSILAPHEDVCQYLNSMPTECKQNHERGGKIGREKIEARKERLCRDLTDVEVPNCDRRRSHEGLCPTRKVRV